MNKRLMIYNVADDISRPREPSLRIYPYVMLSLSVDAL